MRGARVKYTTYVLRGIVCLSLARKAITLRFKPWLGRPFYILNTEKPELIAMLLGFPAGSATPYGIFNSQLTFKKTTIKITEY